MSLPQGNGPLPFGIQGEWNIYDDHDVPVLPFDTFFDTSHSFESRVAEKPVELGGFVSYNKTLSPFTQVVRLGVTSNPTELGEFLEMLDDLAIGTELVSIVTPEKTYLDVNVISYDYARTTAVGVDRLIVDLTFQEVNQVEPLYSNETLPQTKTKQPQDSSTVDKGRQQGSEPRQSVLKQLSTKAGS